MIVSAHQEPLKTAQNAAGWRRIEKFRKVFKNFLENVGQTLLSVLPQFLHIDVGETRK